MQIPKNPWQGTNENALKILETSSNGLSQIEAQKRLFKFGPNSISRHSPIPFLQIFFDQFIDLLVAMLVFASVLSFVLGDFKNGVIIGLIVLLNATIGFAQEYKAEKILKALSKLLPENVKVKREGKEIELSAKYLVPGDIVIIDEGDKVPADMRILESYELKVDEQVLTGEANGQDKMSKTYQDGNLALHERQNLLFMGTTVTCGEALGLVTATGFKTEFGKIATKTIEIQKEHSPLQQKTAQLAKKIALLAACLMLVLIVYHYFVNGNIVDALIFSVAIAAALVPEGLPATVSIALSAGARNLADHKALIKNLVSVETLGSTTVICTDKTGTITTGKMTVKEIWSFPHLKINSDELQKLILRVAILCNDAEVESDTEVGDPIEIALLKWAKDRGYDGQEFRKNFLKINEIPFNARRRFMSVTYKEGSYQFNCQKGAPEVIMAKCRLSQTDEAQINEKINAFASLGYRVLAFSYNEIFLGLVAIFDPPRLEVKDAIAKCRAGDIRVLMITGDNATTAKSIGMMVGIIDTPEVDIIDGKILDTLSDLQLRNKIHSVNIFARILPEQKFRIVDQLMKMGETVAVTGDGVNDAPALKRADIGIAMGITGTDVSKEAADMILLDDNFATIVQAVREGRNIFDNIKKFLFFIFTHNFGELLIVLLGFILGLPLTMLPVQILAVDLGTDVLPSMAFIAEKGSDVMKTKPRDKKVQLLRTSSLWHLSLLGTIIGIGAIINFIAVLKTTGNYAAATTVSFTTLAICQFFNAFMARTPQKSVFSYPFFSNKYLFGAILISLGLLLAIIYTQTFNNLLNTSPFPLYFWLRILLVGIIFVATEEIYKMIKKRYTAE